jgi:hypothetical protein
MEVFIAGIMQGSRDDDRIVDQNYRSILIEAFNQHLPNAIVTDPWSLNPNSVSYNLEQARDTFLINTTKAAEADVLIAYLPQASMGTAIEMWTAFRAKVPIVVVSPMKHNWVVWVTADETFYDLESLLDEIESGRFAEKWEPKKNTLG